MYRLLAFFAALFLTFVSQVSADNINLLRLDSVIAERPNITTAKEKKLAQLRSSLASTTNEEEKLALFEQMYLEYLTYRYDSALVYVQNSIILSKEIGNIAYYGIGIALAYLFKDNRAFCKYICPITVFLKPMSYLSLLRVNCDKSLCVNCGKCRRVCPMNVDMTDNSRRRENGTECILCMECTKVCPKNALGHISGKNRE